MRTPAHPPGLDARSLESPTSSWAHRRPSGRCSGRRGLTATPAAHTKAYFHDVVFRYTYEEAVRDGHLVDWDLVKVKSDARIAGVFLKEGETVENVDPISGAKKLDALEDQRDFATTEIERVVTSPDSNRKILLEAKKYADEHEQRFGPSRSIRQVCVRHHAF